HSAGGHGGRGAEPVAGPGLRGGRAGAGLRRHRGPGGRARGAVGAYRAGGVFERGRKARGAGVGAAVEREGGPLTPGPSPTRGEGGDRAEESRAPLLPSWEKVAGAKRRSD